MASFLLLHSVFTAVMMLALPGTGALAETVEPPSFVIFYTDDMGYSHPGCYGGDLAPTPAMDSLARNGVRFTQGYVSGCVCTPSRVGLLTGRYQARTGHDHFSTRRPGTGLSLEEKLMGQYFKEAGYATAAFGKWHVGEEPGHRPTERGFDVFFGPMANKNEVEHYLDGTKPVDKPAMDSPALAELAVKFIEANRERPFLLYIPFTAVHSPHEASPEYFTHLTIEDDRERNYAAMTLELDEAIGTVMDKIRSLGLEEQCLIFHISDNGGQPGLGRNQPLRGSKWSLLEGGIRVPFCVQWKGRIGPGRILDVPVIQLDVLPTLLAAAGLAPDPDIPLDGINLLPLLLGESDTLDREALFWRFAPQYAVRKGNWKLVRHEVDRAPELFHLGEDLGETTDLSAQYPAKFQELASLYAFWESTMRPPRDSDRRAGGLEARAKVLAERRARQQAREKDQD